MPPHFRRDASGAWGRQEAVVSALEEPAGGGVSSSKPETAHGAGECGILGTPYGGSYGHRATHLDSSCTRPEPKPS